MTDPSLDREALALFERLLEIAEDERDAWIAANTKGNPELARRLQAIREADRNASLRTGAAVDAIEEEPPPARIGAYRIVERIGRGGMGSVYRGERDAGDFTHVAAIKIIKPGLLSETLIERFQRERQTLASLTHPNITQLYDGGETPNGSPYIIMEYVDGLPLLQWVERHDVPVAERRRLFRDICSAVGFAHRNLIVHRDLTPSNVLVTRDGAVKLIDFGIARATDGNMSGGTSARPSIGSLSLTPGYAAPERMTSAEVTTAADIYSLGKLLEKLIPTAAGDREFAAIVTRATAEDPVDRYPTADALDADVRAWDESLPVSAVGGGRSYIAAKFFKRHRFGVVMTIAAVSLLVGAFGVTLHAYTMAERARAAETMRFDQLRSLANYMLFDLNDRLERVIGNTEARIDLAGQAQTYLSALAASPAVNDEIRLETAQGFIRLARMQGVPAEPNLGEEAQAKSNLDQAARLLRDIRDPALPVEATTARLHAYRALIQAHHDTDPEAANQSIAAARSVIDNVPESARDLDWFLARSTVRKAQLALADLADEIEEIPRLAAELEQDIAQWPAEARTARQADLDRAYALYYRAYAASMTEGSLPASLSLYQEAEERFRALEAALPNDPIVLYMLAWTGYSAFPAASRSGDLTQSTHFLDLAQTTIDRLIAIEANDARLRTLADNIGEAQSQLLRDQGRFAEAIARQREVVAGREAALTPERRAGGLSNLAFSQTILGLIARDARDRRLACASWQDAERNLTELERRNELLGFLAGFLPGIRANVAKCAAGRPVSEFGPLR